MDKTERAEKRAVIRSKISIPSGTRLKEGDLEFLYRFVTQYDERFRGRKIALEIPARNLDGTINKNHIQYKCLTFGERGISIHEEHKAFDDGKLSCVYVDHTHWDAKDILLCFKQYVNNGWFLEDDDLTSTLVFGPEYRW